MPVRGPRRGGVPAAPQPPRALAHRRREQGERGDEEGLRERQGQDPGGRDRQHDPLRRRDDLAPAARRQRRAHPRQQPLAGEEQVARGPDREHPRAVRGGDVDAEGEDQERVDLAVEARPQRGRRPGAPRHPVRRPRPARARRRRASRAARPACRARTSPRPARRRRRRAWPRASVTQDAGPSRSPGPRARPRASAAAMVTAQATPTIQPAAPSPAVPARTASSSTWAISPVAGPV